MRKQERREEKGITLVALVVTIIVLIILAGVTLNIVLDNDGIINKAKQALIDLANADNRVLEDPKPVCYVTAFEASDIKLSLRCYVPNILYRDVFFEMNEKVLIEFNKLGIQIPFNRLVIQTLDVDGKVVINKRKGEKRLWKSCSKMI